MYALVLEVLTWAYAVRSVLLGAGDLEAEEKVSVLGMIRCCTAGLFLLYYTYIKMKLDPFKLVLCKHTFFPVASFVAYIHLTSPESAILHNIRVMAAVTALSSAVISSVGNMILIFETHETAEPDISKMFMPCPFLARVPSHLLRHGFFYSSFLRHPHQEELILYINLIVYPLVSTFVAKWWLNSAIPFWSLIPQRLWAGVEIYAGLTSLVLLIVLVDGGVRNNVPLKPKRGEPRPQFIYTETGDGKSIRKRVQKSETGETSDLDADALKNLLSSMQGDSSQWNRKA
mmetsp:Transcript_40108/g.55733  ORF Transcript_40108/g.55733 Transcript_40108/m.55733 type:complete len:287 (-) Transcript_40108:112-972(-)|eukprot:CAMPEP_0196592160 /NCGR_PEP_ID=MMETSP1081-20130531/71893_1 /TAXON_ID=36882 /ORGANISM="Pyramimonas amylifera, Strain CCMP720" /LENGTH=286 /DNA_ID=CAMNT_0041915757 /DNA_START=290 /DNA_END=1150 /DNA_ORIENTATION=-